MVAPADSTALLSSHARIEPQLRWSVPCLNGLPTMARWPKKNLALPGAAPPKWTPWGTHGAVGAHAAPSGQAPDLAACQNSIYTRPPRLAALYTRVWQSNISDSLSRLTTRAAFPGPCTAATVFMRVHMSHFSSGVQSAMATLVPSCTTPSLHHTRISVCI